MPRFVPFSTASYTYFEKVFEERVFLPSVGDDTVVNERRTSVVVAAVVRVCTPTLLRATVFRYEVGRSADTGVARCARAVAAFPVRPRRRRRRRRLSIARATVGRASRGLHNQHGAPASRIPQRTGHVTVTRKPRLHPALFGRFPPL